MSGRLSPTVAYKLTFVQLDLLLILWYKLSDFSPKNRTYS